MSTVDQDYDDADRAYINDPAFWKMIDERRKEVGIPWAKPRSSST